MKSTRALFAAWCTVAMAVMTGACALGPKPPPAPPRHTDLGLGITSFALQNGLRVVLVKDPNAAQVQVTMRYQVGAVDDRGEAGMAHLVEHMMFQQVLGGQTLFATLEDITTYFNAYTLYDSTTYIARAPASRLDTMLSVEAVRLGFRCTSITDAAFEREREVVVNEIRQHDEASEVTAALHRAAYPDGHPYGQMIGGNVATVGAITRERACQWVDAHYAPGNAVLVISGNVNERGVESSLGKFIARISKRTAAAPAQIAPLPAEPKHMETIGPLDTDAVLIAWPMPKDPQIAIKLRAIRGAVYGLIDSKVAGTVMPRPLGDERAPMWGVLIEKTDKETAEEVIKKAREGVDLLPLAFRKTGWEQFDAFAFQSVKQSAIYDLYASLQDGGNRDAQLAAYVLAGRDPQEAMASEFAGVRELDYAHAEQLAHRYFDFDRATVVSLKAKEGKKSGAKVVLRPEVHDMGQRRTARDPADAHKPAEIAALPSVPGMRTRRLANGLEVVLLPVTSVPAIDIRLVFRSGNTDDNGKVGLAEVAAHGLEWNWRYLNDAILFAAAGGPGSVDVSGDHTTFSVRGVDMHIDVLLAGMRRWVRDGRYSSTTDDALDALRRIAHKRRDEETVLTETLMGAMFGADHPYARVGLPGDLNLTSADAAAFRAAHYTPDNATLVISGRFDADLADKWIDFLFGDWSGRAGATAEVPRATVKPDSLAKYEDLSQLYLAVALPVSDVGYAQQLVTAQLVEELAASIRQELGASYGVHAQLAELRLAKMYMLGGWIDPSRAKAALELLRDRIAALRSDPDAAARAFVSARAHVLTRLSGFTGSASALGASVEHDIDLGRKPMSDVETAAVVRDLTIEGMTTALADLDLAKALVLMRGPEAEVNGTFEVLGRTPTKLTFDQAAADDKADDPNAKPAEHAARRDDDPIRLSEIEDAITDQELASKQKLTLKLMPGLLFASVVEQELQFHVDCCDGAYVMAEVGYHLDASKSIGLQLGVGSATGSYSISVAAMRYPMTLTPIDIAGVLEVTGYDRLWGDISLGVHIDRLTDTDDDRTMPDATATYTSLAVGLSGGVDILKLGTHRIGLGGHISGTLASDSGYGAATLGVVYRRW